MRDDDARRVRWFPAVVIVVLLAFLTAGTVNNLVRNPQPRLVAEGRKVSAATFPGPYGGLVGRAIADLDALTRPNGATLAGADGPWRFVWPRDASFVAAAYCAAGRPGKAERVLDFLDGTKPSSGRWEARYADSGEPILDGREPQLDGSGWVLWATWFCRAGSRYWDLVRGSADQIVAELGADGLPGVSPDYWERPESELTLGTVAPLLTGLRSAVSIATRSGHPDEAARWSAALEKLSRATDRRFGPDYPRTPARAVSFLEPGLEPIGVGGGADAIVTVLGPPFAPARDVVDRAIDRAHAVLTQPNGGVTPGENWRTDGVAWTPQTALFALSAAARGDRATARELLTWLDHYRTGSGALPEKVNRDLEPAGEAPLGWTSALVVLAGAALEKPLPIP
ncbi:glucoamylase [Kribbella turkmenica]|uniref:Glucoamylase n=1 Tax=Kribbella turkmenica TaxID=2530375 RepID=A0A4V2YEJ6_9ACTN|nr:glucoamylase [Kribbella turkmenica]TDD19586.1 glucoamylase [Kribbella turkmenica]